MTKRDQWWLVSAFIVGGLLVGIPLAVFSVGRMIGRQVPVQNQPIPFFPDANPRPPEADVKPFESPKAAERLPGAVDPKLEEQKEEGNR